ncbi:hypothetical protein [Mucilaginibacter terrae]|uniref:Signal transduction histidine kinase dimerisation/phosphoacceptor domain-containing protein n=1 Tax=Mucilaginibacter terrae TaxID=1955052 RepID=A0ABU3GXX1_9SPHI|nr:hypothetical protein [Mucilaginibacter terrae]MDT3403520.1 hypothetical protein [Mucilaginibacter terrae]
MGFEQDEEEYKAVEGPAIRTFKHDIKNQLSNIHLALAQLPYEVENPTEDFAFYLDTIKMSCAKIDSMVKELGV